MHTKLQSKQQQQQQQQQPAKSNGPAEVPPSQQHKACYCLTARDCNNVVHTLAKPQLVWACVHGIRVEAHTKDQIYTRGHMLVAGA